MTRDVNTKQTLNNGVEMPRFGLGVFKTQPGDEVYNAVRWALDMGYRLIDTASMYKNEEDVGRAVKESGIPRKDIFVTTKLWIDDLDNVQAALEASLVKLDMEYIDMYLMHWPGTDENRRLSAWETMLKLSEQGKIKVCGVSNFMQDQLEQIIEKSGVIPSNNQIELHPWNQYKELRKFCAKKDISITSWGPIFHGNLDKVPAMQEIGEKYGKSAAQATLRWHIQQGDINLIPKSAKKERIAENMQVFDFELSDEDMSVINNLDGIASFAFNPHVFNGDLEEARLERDERLGKQNLSR